MHTSALGLVENFDVFEDFILLSDSVGTNSGFLKRGKNSEDHCLGVRVYWYYCFWL
jgi:hypothetical protein